jgi:pSer/pThr/pTyr-binding forkhead associated (FHA) protein
MLDHPIVLEFERRRWKVLARPAREMVLGPMAKRSAPPAATDENEKKPPTIRTRTLPEAARGAYLEGPDVVTMLRVYGTDVEFPLPRDRHTFSLGSAPERDIALPEKYLSALHCVLERRGSTLRVHDQGSHNGTYFDGRRESVFELRPGATFTAASIRFLALNDEMRTAYPVLADILGSEDEHVLRSSGDVDASPSDLIVTATSGSHIVITGDDGSDQLRLARTIHAISLVRGRPIVEIDRVPDDRAQQRSILDRASRATLAFSIDTKAPVTDATFASMLFSPSFHVRVIAIAPTISKANDVLGEAHVRTMRNVVVRPLAQRAGAILRLLDRMFIERNTTLRTSDLMPSNQAALQAHSWPDNFDGLRLAADRLVVIACEGSLSKSAKALALSTSTLHYWFSQLGLSLPLMHGG